MAPLFNPAGRIGRLRWLARLSVANLIAVLLLFGIYGFGLLRVGETSLTNPGLLVLAMAFLWFYSVITIQRSHDLGWPAWTALIALVPGFNLVWLVLPGQRATNDFGPPPARNGAGVALLTLITPLLLGFAIFVVMAVLPYAGRVIDGTPMGHFLARMGIHQPR